jgi:molecular chaperone GrpE
MSDHGKTGTKKGNGQEPAFSVVDRRPGLRDDAAAAAEPRYPTVVEDLKARAEEAERRAREISAAYRRIEEERDAFRERLARDLERRVDVARVEMMRKVLGVLDDLDRAIAAGATASDPAPLLSGVTLIREHLLRVLASEGVQALDLAGQRFDPAVAEAVSIEETRDPERDNLILEENGRGYMLGTTLLRPARVRVARCLPEPSVENPDDRRESGLAGDPDAPAPPAPRPPARRG